MSRKLLVLASLFLSGAVAATTSPAISLFDPHVLAGWSSLQPNETVPYLEEGLRSELLFSARSSAGSYAFVTRIDNTLDRDAVGPEEIKAFFSAESYRDLAPVGFGSEILSVGEDRTLRALVVSFRTARLGYSVGASGPVLVKTVFVPVVVRDARTRRYFNWIYVANFRGSPNRQDELRAFDRLWQQAKLNDASFSRVEPERFNALRPELVVASAEPAAPLAKLRQEASEARQNPASEQLAETLVAGLGGSAGSLAAGAFRQFTSDHPEAALARVFRYLEKAELAELQEKTWQQAWQSAPSPQKAWLAALVLAQSLVAGDAELAERVLRDSTSAGVSVSSLDCDQLGEVLDLLRPHRDHSLLATPRARQFLAVVSTQGCLKLLVLLRERKVEVLPLEAVAVAKRSGGFKLLPSMLPSRLPLLANQGGKLVVVRRAEEGREAVVEVEEVSSLVNLLETLP